MALFIQKCSLSGSKLSGNTELLLEIQKNKTDPGNKHFLFCHAAIELSRIPFESETEVDTLIEVQQYNMLLFSLAHKLNFAGHVIVTSELRRMHFPHPDFFLRWNSNLQQVDFSQSFASNKILGLVVLAVNDGFLHLHTCVISPFFCLHFCHLEIQI